MTERVVIGIDPGLGGAIAAVRRIEGATYCLDTIYWDGGSGVIELLRHYANTWPKPEVWLEKVNAMPKQGIASTWKFAQNFGFYTGAVPALQLPLRIVRPVDWQKGLGLPKVQSKTAHKNNLKSVAAAMFPDVKVTLKNADALLIAHHGLIQK